MLMLAIVLFLVLCLLLLWLGAAFGGDDDDGELAVVDNEDVAAQAPAPGERPKRAFIR